jgi:phosphate transport system substrate-binding protein
MTSASSLILFAVLAQAAPDVTAPALPGSQSAVEVDLVEEEPTVEEILNLPEFAAPPVSTTGDYTAAMSEAIKEFPEYDPPADRWTGTLRILSSSSLAPALVRLGDAFTLVHPDLEVMVKQGGTSRALEALASGACDLISVSRDLTPAEIEALKARTGRKVLVVPMARDAVCIYVHADNPLPGITREQLNGTFSLTHRLTKDFVSRWTDLDPASPLGDAFIPLYVPRANRGTMQAFIEYAMPGEAVQTAMRYDEPTPSSVVNACCAYPTALGIAGYADRQPRARIVPVSDGPGKPFVAPSFDTLRDRSYPMWRPLNLVLLTDPEGKPQPMALDLARFILSESGQDLCGDMAMVPALITEIPEEIVPRADEPRE